MMMYTLFKGNVIFSLTWASCVARSTTKGNARAYIRGTGDKHRFPRLLYIYSSVKGEGARKYSSIMNKFVATFCLGTIILCFSSCGTFTYRASRNIEIEGEPGTDFYLVNQKESRQSVNGKKTEALANYEPKENIVCIGTTDEKGKGILQLSTKEYKRSDKWVYAVKEGCEPTRFRLHRKFNALMLADVVLPLTFFFDHASILNEKKVYNVSQNAGAGLYVSEAVVEESPEILLKKQQKREKWDRFWSNLNDLGVVLEAAGRELEGNQSAGYVADVPAYGNQGADYANNSELAAAERELQLLYVERERILNRQRINNREVSRAGSKQVRKAGASLKANRGQYRVGQGNYVSGAAERNAKTSAGLRVELRNIDKRIEACLNKINRLKNGGGQGTVNSSTPKTSEPSDVYHRNVNDRTYRNLEGQLINMQAGTMQYNDSERRNIQNQMRELRKKYNLEKSSWEDWTGL